MLAESKRKVKDGNVSRGGMETAMREEYKESTSSRQEDVES